MTANFSKENKENIRLIANESNKLFNEVRDMCLVKMEELKGLISETGAIFVVGKELGVDLDIGKKTTKKIKEGKDMSVWDDIDLSTQEFNPFLKIKNGITYHLQLVDPTVKPRPSVDGYGNDQHIWDVKLLSLSPAEAYDEADKEGKALFMKNKTYSFGMKKTAMRRFKDLWEAVEVVNKFSFKRTGQSFQTDYIFKAE